MSIFPFHPPQTWFFAKTLKSFGGLLGAFLPMRTHSSGDHPEGVAVPNGIAVSSAFSSDPGDERLVRKLAINAWWLRSGFCWGWFSEYEMLVDEGEGHEAEAQAHGDSSGRGGGL